MIVLKICCFNMKVTYVYIVHSNPDGVIFEREVAGNRFALLETQQGLRYCLCGRGSEAIFLQTVAGSGITCLQGHALFGIQGERNTYDKHEGKTDH